MTGWRVGAAAIEGLAGAARGASAPGGRRGVGGASRAAAVALLLAPLAAAAQQQPPAAKPFASVPDPTGITVAANGDVLVVSDAPGSGTGILRFGADGQKVDELRAKDTTLAHSRIASIDTAGFKGLALLSPKGVLVIFAEGASGGQGAAQLSQLAAVDLGSAQNNQKPITPMFDFDASAGAGGAGAGGGGHAAPITLAAARFDDLAVSPVTTQVQPSGSQPGGSFIDLFMTGVTAASGGGAGGATTGGGTPFLVNVSFEPTQKTLLRAVLATSQASIAADAKDRFGVGIWTPASQSQAGPQGAQPESLVVAALPTKTSRSAQGGNLDALVAVGATWGWGDKNASAPGVMSGADKQPLLLASGGMSSSAPGDLYAVLTAPQCGQTAGPSLMTLGRDGKITCQALPPTQSPETYVDVAAGSALYVTDEQGGGVLQVPLAAQPPATSQSARASRSAAETDYGFGGEEPTFGALSGGLRILDR